MTTPLRCRCGHSFEAHELLRGGRECSACACRRFGTVEVDLPQRSAVVPGVAWNRFRAR